ncbi:hypothetical protein HN51_064115 [Arachis hypogaea]
MLPSITPRTIIISDAPLAIPLKLVLLGTMSLTSKPPPKIRIEGEHCPGAVVEWYQRSASKDQRHDFDLSLKAKKHLVSLGWTFSYCDKKTRWELRYKSPSGKTYISLRTACKACIEEKKKDSSSSSN